MFRVDGKVHGSHVVKEERNDGSVSIMDRHRIVISGGMRCVRKDIFMENTISGGNDGSSIEIKKEISFNTHGKS